MLVLASSSPTRVIILKKLGLTFTTVAPDIDESSLPNESAHNLVYRLSQQKVVAVAKQKTGLIIGSDQVALVDGVILTKPYQHKNAVQQLQLCSGKTVVFLTSICLLNTQTQQKQTLVEKTEVVFRNLLKPQIEAYLQAEKPYQCAGSFKSEGLGIILFKSINGRDNNALMGLPLMALVDMLLIEGVDILTQPSNNK